MVSKQKILIVDDDNNIAEPYICSFFCYAIGNHFLVT